MWTKHDCCYSVCCSNMASRSEDKSKFFPRQTKEGKILLLRPCSPHLHHEFHESACLWANFVHDTGCAKIPCFLFRKKELSSLCFNLQLLKHLFEALRKKQSRANVALFLRELKKYISNSFHNFYRSLKTCILFFSMYTLREELS